MKPTKTVRVLLLLLPLMVGGGCSTRALWTEARLDCWNEPADNPHLRIYEDAKQKDLLVVYDEYSERHAAIQTRAYWAHRNQERVAQRLRPSFSSVDLSRSLTPVPMFPAPLSTINLPEALYVVATTNSQTFAVYSGNHEMDSHDLPVYNDGMGQVERAALTPLTVVADLTIIGGCLYLYIWENSGTPPFPANH